MAFELRLITDAHFLRVRSWSILRMVLSSFLSDQGLASAWVGSHSRAKISADTKAKILEFNDVFMVSPLKLKNTITESIG